jgi:hypothetical protein
MFDQAKVYGREANDLKGTARRIPQLGAMRLFVALKRAALPILRLGKD